MKMPMRGSRQIIADHANPKTLTVVSSDRRIRQAATRRRTRSLTADQFWELIDDLKERADQNVRPGKHKPTPDLRNGASPIDPTESALWLETFRDVTDAPGIQAALAPNEPLLTDAEIAEIEREIEREDAADGR